MKLYFSPLSCSAATRVAFYEAGADAQVDFIEVDSKTKTTVSGGEDFRIVNPLGLVPTLRLDDGAILTENAAILQYVADRYPETQLAPREPFARLLLQQWLCFTGTELHKQVYTPLLDASAPAEVKDYARKKIPLRLAHVARAVEGRETLLDRFSVADAYLLTVLNWSGPAGVDLAPWPAVGEYLRQMNARPSVARAVAEEMSLYQRKLARQAAAR